VNELETRQFEAVGAKYYSGNRREGLRQLRELASTLTEPLDKGTLRFYEIRWLVDLGEVSEAGTLIADLKKMGAEAAVSPTDARCLDIGVTLLVMAWFAEANLLVEQGAKTDALTILEVLTSQFPQQLALPGLAVFRDEILALQGMLLGDLDRWQEALPLLESTVPSETWKGIVTYYLGRSYFETNDYIAAERKLREALGLELTPQWESRTHYVLGLTEYNLSNVVAARREFELCIKTGDPEYLRESKVWGWLEATARPTGACRGAPFPEEREQEPSKPKVN
jgi:tetratricopeptide (TPR) repeat protein